MKTIKAWAINLHYDGKDEILFIFPKREDAVYRYKENRLFKPEYTIIPCEVRFKKTKIKK